MSGAEAKWTLAWPRERSISEAEAVLSIGSLADGPDPMVGRAHWLLKEAFLDAEVAEGFMRIAQRERLPKKLQPTVLSPILPGPMKQRTAVYPEALQFLHTLSAR